MWYDVRLIVHRLCNRLYTRSDLQGSDWKGGEIPVVQTPATETVGGFRRRVGIGWRLFRPFTLAASISPALVGTGAAVHDGHFRPWLFTAFLFACLLVQSATNMFNEYFDYKRGLDDERMVGIAGTIVRDGVSPQTVIRIAWAFVGMSVLLGLYICSQTSWFVALVGTGCLCVGYLYSGGPKPLAYTPFGELAAAVSMGPAIILLAYYTQTGRLTAGAAWVSVPVGLLIGGLLLANNIRDMDHDREGGRRTVAILLGRARGRTLFGLVLAAAYAAVLALVAAGQLTPWALVTFLTVPTAFWVWRQYYQFTQPAKLHPAVKGTAVLLFRFGFLLCAGFLLSLWV
ncbi:MAG: 1,4-dihydroxy-2-naphthoate polyprenyltransferase [Alicyclobacillaceae bacterium]|nr:1,4-dihydroxy-2-naphthoate polyprenyltransferase [Alicyclobacillaceae bacterium]